MPSTRTVTLLPNDLDPGGKSAGWVIGGGAPNAWSAVNDGSDSTYLEADAGGDLETLRLGTTTLNPGEWVSGLNMRIRAATGAFHRISYWPSLFKAADASGGTPGGVGPTPAVLSNQAISTIQLGPWPGSFSPFGDVGYRGRMTQAGIDSLISAVAEWFPKKERALATGIFNAGTNVGAIVAPLTVPWIALQFGWQWAFILTGAVGLMWLLFWIPLYRKPEDHPRLSKAELAYIQSDPPDAASPTPWMKLIPHRQTCAFAFAKYLTDPIWWFYLFWIPNFLRDQHGLQLSTIGPPLIAIYLIADVGSVGGGWISSSLIKRGWTISRARKTAMLICALSVTPIVFVSKVSNLWVAVGLIGLAAAAHQGWSANLFTTVSDMFPRRAVGSVVGIGGMAGAMGGVTFAVTTGFILDRTHNNYLIMFAIAGSIYLFALVLVHLLVPKLEPIEDVQAAIVKPVSFGSIAGFGFIGLVFGTFGGWLGGLLLRVTGQALLTCMTAGALSGAILGAAVGVILCKRMAAQATD